jgi:hypothetical protein
MKTIERTVEEAVLEKKNVCLSIDGHDFPIAPPTLATLVSVSALVSELPDIKSNDVLTEVLSTAQKSAVIIAKVTAMLILGAKRVEQCIPIKDAAKSHKNGIFGWIRDIHSDISEYDYLTKIILDNCSPTTLQGIITNRLNDLQIASFFGITVSLNTKNITAPTKTPRTASGEES